MCAKYNFTLYQSFKLFIVESLEFYVFFVLLLLLWLFLFFTRLYSSPSSPIYTLALFVQIGCTHLVPPRPSSSLRRNVIVQLYKFCLSIWPVTSVLSIRFTRFFFSTRYRFHWFCFEFELYPNRCAAHERAFRTLHFTWTRVYSHNHSTYRQIRKYDDTANNNKCISKEIQQQKIVWKTTAHWNDVQQCSVLVILNWDRFICQSRIISFHISFVS